MISISNFWKADALLIVVSKGRSCEEILYYYEQGVRDFGENRVQEALDKMEKLPKDIRWHYIGKLQKNKVNKIRGKFYLIHSVDTFELALKLSKEPQAILLEVNTSGEGSKSGLSPEQWEEHLDELKALKNLDIRGLMTMAPHTEDQEAIRRCFSRLRECRDHWGFKELSMGMSSDYPVALEEGATIVRIGHILF